MDPSVFAAGFALGYTVGVLTGIVLGAWLVARLTDVVVVEPLVRVFRAYRHRRDGRP